MTACVTAIVLAKGIGCAPGAIDELKPAIIERVMAQVLQAVRAAAGSLSHAQIWWPRRPNGASRNTNIPIASRNTASARLTAASLMASVTVARSSVGKIEKFTVVVIVVGAGAVVGAVVGDMMAG